MEAVTTAPLVVFGDAVAAAVTVLRAALADRAEDFAQGATVGRRVPGDRSTETPMTPFVLVAKDSDVPHNSMANAVCTLRVTVWHSTTDQAHDLAMLCQALLVVHSGPVIRGVRPATGPLAAVDPDSGLELASITVTANIRPQPLP